MKNSVAILAMLALVTLASFWSGPAAALGFPKPIQLFGKWGIYTLLAGVGSGAATVYMKLFEQVNMNRNPLLILTGFLLFMGVQFIVLGLLGELNARTYYEAQGKPIYVVKERINLG